VLINNSIGGRIIPLFRNFKFFFLFFFFSFFFALPVLRIFCPALRQDHEIVERENEHAWSLMNNLH